MGTWDLNSGPSACQTSVVPLNYSASPFVYHLFVCLRLSLAI